MSPASLNRRSQSRVNGKLGDRLSRVCIHRLTTYPVKKAAAMEGVGEEAIELPTGKKPQLLALGTQGALEFVCGTCLKLKSCKA